MDIIFFSNYTLYRSRLFSLFKYYEVNSYVLLREVMRYCDEERKLPGTENNNLVSDETNRMRLTNENAKFNFKVTMMHFLFQTK